MLDGVRSWSLASWQEYQAATPDLSAFLQAVTAREAELSRVHRGSTLNGYSITAGKSVDFNIDWPEDGKTLPNWRETLVCPETHLYNRVRAAVDFLIANGAKHRSKIYVTEQNTHFFNWVSGQYPETIGSEFIDGVEIGRTSDLGFRCEDLTRLTFQDNSFDFLLTFDVFEHIPDFMAALRECYRVLVPGGRMILTAPFGIPMERNIIRARVDSDGGIEHLHPPQFHFDPIRPQGVLCFQEFGWEFLDQMRNSGFADARCVLYWSERSAYLGGLQILMVAEK